MKTSSSEARIEHGFEGNSGGGEGRFRGGAGRSGSRVTRWTRSPNRPTASAGNACRRAAAALRGSSAADLQDRAPHQELHLVRRPTGEELPLVDESDAAATLGLVEIGRGDEDRQPSSQELVEDPPEVAAGDGVHAVGGLVQKEDLGRVDEGARAAPASASFRPTGCPPGGSGTGVRLLKASSRSIVPPGRGGARRRCRRRSGGSPSPSGRRTGRTAGSCSRCVLDLRFGLADDVAPATQASPRGRLHDRRQEPHGRGLAGPVRARPGRRSPPARRRESGRPRRRDRRISWRAPPSGWRSWCLIHPA